MDAKLTEKQIILKRELERRDKTLGDMYYGAITVVQDTKNPECFSQAAHSIRELIEKLPTLITVGVPEQKGKGNITKLQLKEMWSSTLRKTSCRTNEGWNGEIDKSLNNFLKKIDSYLSDDAIISTKLQCQKILQSVEGDGRRLPDDLEKENLNLWKHLRDYFVGVAHHRPTTNSDFMEQLEVFQQFILDKFYPETIADFEQIDKLIGEGES